MYVCACCYGVQSGGRYVVVLLTQPGIVFVQHVIRWTNLKRGTALLVVGDTLQLYLFPFWSAENPIGVISILANAIQFDWILPVTSHILLCAQKNSQFRISTEILQLHKKTIMQILVFACIARIRRAQ